MPFGNEQQQILNENDVNCGNISTVNFRVNLQLLKLQFQLRRSLN